MLPTIILVISCALLLFYIYQLRKTKLTTKIIVLIALVSSISYILYMIQFIKYPQGGGISLFSMLPTLLISLTYGPTIGVTSGLIFGILKLLNGIFIVHPAQFLLDYLLSTMALGLAGILGTKSKATMLIGCLSAIGLSVFINIVSGAVFFAEYAPNGMNGWLYSALYNLSSAGVEGLLTLVIVASPPIEKLLKQLRKI